MASSNIVQFKLVEKVESKGMTDFREGVKRMLQAKEFMKKGNFTMTITALFIGAMEVVQSLDKLEPKEIDRILGE